MNTVPEYFAELSNLGNGILAEIYINPEDFGIDKITLIANDLKKYFKIDAFNWKRRSFDSNLLANSC